MLRPPNFHTLKYRKCIVLLGVILSVATFGTAEAVTEVVELDASWSDYNNHFVDVQSLSAMTPAGYTATLTGSVPGFANRPKVYQEFDGVDVSQVGQKISASFDVQFHTVPDIGDTTFRLGFGDTTTNQGLVPLMIDTGQSFGSSFRMRYDDSLTDEAEVFAAGNFSGFMSASGTFGDGGGNPTFAANDGVGGLQDTVAIHSFVVTAERVERNVDTSFPLDGIPDEVINGWYTTASWTSDETDAETLFVDTNNAGFAQFDVDTGLGVYDEGVFSREAIENIDTVGLMIYLDDPFSQNGGGSGSYSISNFVLEYEDGVEASLLCNLDGDSDCDGTDIDLLYATSPTTADISAWLSQASDPSNPYKASVDDVYVLGDVDLNGDVDSTDLGLLLNNFSSTSGVGWGGGDLDADAIVDSTDLGLLLNNFSFTSSASAVVAVPEPKCLAFLGLLVFVCLGRART